MAIAIGSVFMLPWNGRWVDRKDIYYEDLVKIEAPFFSGTPPQRGMYLLKDEPFSPVACWREDQESQERSLGRRIVFCGRDDGSLRFDIEWLIRTARRRVQAGYVFGGAARPRAEDFFFSRPEVPADQAIRNSLSLLRAANSEGPRTASTATGISTGLGSNVDALAAKSPTLQRQLQALNAAGWSVAYQQPGLPSMADSVRKTVFVGDFFRTRPEWAVSQLSHELGHFEHPPLDDFSSKAAFLRSEQLSEGYATLSNITAQREILSIGGVKIPLSVSPGNVLTYNQIYDQALGSGDWKSAAAAIGAVYGDGEKSLNPRTGEPETYNTLYGDFYDANYGTRH